MAENKGQLFSNSVAKYYAGVETGKKANGTPAIQNKLCSFLTESQRTQKYPLNILLFTYI